ncbi:MAG: carbohydrate ABC transporter permease [Candidatus Gallimonas sp.]
MARNDTLQNEETKKPSSFRYALGAVLAFFGISTKTHSASKKRAKLVGDVVTYIILLFGAFIMVYPFWWMLAGSFAYTNTTFPGNAPIKEMVWWPSLSTVNSGQDGVSFFQNYIELFTNGFSSEGTGGTYFAPGFSYWRALLNNLFYSIVPVVVGVITSASAAFSFSKIQWIGRNKVFFFLLAAIMVPGPSIMTTQYAMYADIGFLNNWMVMVIPGLFGSIMTAFFIRQFLFGLPTSIIEAAKIDGAGYFRIFCSFILPLAMPAIMAQGLLSFMGCWNNYMGSYIMISKGSEWINLPHAMYFMNMVYEETDLAPVIAASVVCVLPVIILFACFQKLIIGSLMLTGSKE